MAFLTSAPPSITSYKDPVKVASTATLALSGVIGSIQIDSVALSSLSTGDRILLKNQSPAFENGIYSLTISGGNYSLARSSDADTSAKLSPNSLVPVSAGALGADNIFQLTNNTVILGTDSLVFVAVDSVALASVATEQARAIAAEALALQKSSNLSDLASVGAAKTNLSLNNVDNTSDANKPVSSAQQTALNLKADLISPVFTTPNIGSATGSISGNAATVTTNANLTGPVTSTGNATAIANAAISNAMLANAAVANLSGTNTGDNSANSLYTANPMTTAGDLIVGGVSGAQGRLGIGSTEKVLATNGTASSWQYAGLGAGSLGTGNIVLGREWPSAFTTGTDVILIGKTATASNGCTDSVIIGQAATAGASPFATIVGDGASAAHSGVAIGRNAAVAGSYSTAVGHGASGGSGAQTVAIGMNANCAGSDSVAIGYGAVAQQNALAIGREANAGATFGMAIGRGSSYTGANSHAMGYGTAAGSGTNGVFIGYGSGLSTASGASNTVVGADSFNGASLTTAYANTILGKGIGKLITTGSSNLIGGIGSASALTTGNGNVILGGSDTANDLTTGTNNIIIGIKAGSNYGGPSGPTTSSSNVVIGGNAGCGSATDSVSLGSGAQGRADRGIAIGKSPIANAADAIAIGYNSVAYTNGVSIGSGSGSSSYGGNDKITIGSGSQSGTGNSGIFIGAGCGTSGASGALTSILGAASGTSLSTGGNQTYVGAYSGKTNATGVGQVCVGYYSGAYATASDEFYLNNQNRTDTAGDKAKSLMYGTFNATASSQTLAINAALSTPYTLAVTGVATFTAAPVVSSVTASQILASSATKEVVSLSTATYPSLTELAYVKGVTSAIQTQLNAAALPSQTSQAGKVLATNGTITSWQYTGRGSGSFGTDNVFLGIAKPAGLAIGTKNTIIGAEAGTALTDGEGNVAVGSYAFKDNTTGGYNIAVGDSALLSNTQGNDNMALGAGALSSNTTGGNNIAVGNYVSQQNTTGSYNTAIGYDSLRSNVTGGHNVALGFNALNAISAGGGNIGIGSDAGKYADSSDEFYLDNQDRMDNSTEKTDSLMYGQFHATASSQTLAINAAVSIPNNLSITAEGYGLKIKEGSDARMGVATLVGGTVTVSNNTVTANTRIMLTAQNNGGTIGFLSVSARTAATSFVILSSSGSDTSIVAWMLVEPA